MPRDELADKAAKADAPGRGVDLWPDGETVTSADLKAITDEDAEALLRDTRFWSYIVRDPTGAVCCWGQGAQKECEDAAIDNAEIWALESWPESLTWHIKQWSVVFWPPGGLSRRGEG